MSWAYWAPKSTTRTVSNESVVMGSSSGTAGGGRAPTDRRTVPGADPAMVNVLPSVSATS